MERRLGCCRTRVVVDVVTVNKPLRRSGGHTRCSEVYSVHTLYFPISLIFDLLYHTKLTGQVYCTYPPVSFYVLLNATSSPHKLQEVFLGLVHVEQSGIFDRLLKPSFREAF